VKEAVVDVLALARRVRGGLRGLPRHFRVFDTHGRPFRLDSSRSRLVLPVASRLRCEFAAKNAARACDRALRTRQL